MLDHDDGDDFVLDVVEEMVESAMSIIYTNYLDRQLIPYTVTQAKDALLQIIEVRFSLSNLTFKRILFIGLVIFMKSVHIVG